MSRRDIVDETFGDISRFLNYRRNFPQMNGETLTDLVENLTSEINVTKNEPPAGVTTVGYGTDLEQTEQPGKLEVHRSEGNEESQETGIFTIRPSSRQGGSKIDTRVPIETLGDPITNEIDKKYEDEISCNFQCSEKEDDQDASMSKCNPEIDIFTIRPSSSSNKTLVDTKIPLKSSADVKISEADSIKVENESEKDTDSEFKIDDSQTRVTVKDSSDTTV